MGQNNLPQIVGRPGSVREGRVSLGGLPQSGLQGVTNAARGIGDAIGSLARLKEEEDNNRTKRALIDANGELDGVLADLSSRSGANAAGIVEELQQKAQEIRERHGANLSGRSAELFRLQYDNVLGAAQRQTMTHKIRETDKTAGESNRILAGQYKKQLALDSNSDEAFGNLLTVVNAEFDRVGLAPEARAALWRAEVDQVAAARIDAAVKAENFDGARVLLERYKPDGDYAYGMSKEMYNAYLPQFSKRDHLATVHRETDAIIGAVQKGFDPLKHDFTLAAQSGRDLIRKNYQGKDRDERLKAYDDQIGELSKYHAARLVQYKAVLRNEYAGLDYAAASRLVSKRLLDVENPALRDDIQKQLLGSFGKSRIEKQEDFAALDQTIGQIADGEYIDGGRLAMPIRTIDDCKAAHVLNGGNWSESVRSKCQTLLEKRANLAKPSQLTAVLKSLDLKKEPLGLRDFLAEAVSADKPLSQQELRVLVSDYALKTPVSNHNYLWADTTSTPAAMASNRSDAYMNYNQALLFYQNTRKSRMQNSRKLPPRYRKEYPSDAELENWMNNMGWSKDGKGRYRRNEESEK